MMGGMTFSSNEKTEAERPDGEYSASVGDFLCLLKGDYFAAFWSFLTMSVFSQR